MKYKLLRFSLLSVLVMFFGGLAQAENPETLTIDFENDASTYASWTFTNIKAKCTNSNVTAHGGSYFGNTDGKASGSIVTKETVSNPGVLTFYVSKESTNTTASTWYVKVSSDGETWNVVGDGQSASSMARGTWVEVSKDLSSYSNVYVGIFYDGTTAKRDIDDITLAMADASDTRATTTLTLAQGYATTGEVGGRIALPRVTVTDANGSVLENATVTWESSNTEVATINAVENTISLVAAGKTTITASYAGDETNYKSSKASFTLTVKEYVAYTTIASMLENITATKTDVKYTFNNLLVTYVNGSYTYVNDGQNNMLLYGTELGLKAGDIIRGSICGQLYKYN